MRNYIALVYSYLNSTAAAAVFYLHPLTPPLDSASIILRFWIIVKIICARRAVSMKWDGGDQAPLHSYITIIYRAVLHVSSCCDAAVAE